MPEPAARRRLREAREKATAEREAGEVRCTIPCDPDCDAVCHSDHQAGHKKDHWPWDCPAADRYDWGSDFNNGMVKQLRDQRNQARTELTEMRLAAADRHVARPTMYEGAVQAAIAVLCEGTPSAATEQVVLAALRFALPRHETQHAAAWKAAHERAVHFELEAVKATERVAAAEKEVERLRGVETKLRGHLDSIGAAHQEGISARRTLDAMRETEIFELNAQLTEATTLLGHFVNHEDQPCRLDHHGACQEHGGSSLRRCDVAAGRELLARIRGGTDDAS